MKKKYPKFLLLTNANQSKTMRKFKNTLAHIHNNTHEKYPSDETKNKHGKKRRKRNFVFIILFYINYFILFLSLRNNPID